MEKLPNVETKFLLRPVRLHEEFELTEADIENLGSEKDITGKTAKIMRKKGFPTYHWNADSKLLVIFPHQNDESLKIFKLKEGSSFEAWYNNRYETNN